ncbi:YqiA/YcfP family alpha/beta fold hydrolase [Hydrogenophaga sp. PAMC20947]|uniref:YqiA/YcfP family alpha/beta fold hydrolase n=1 Tax=Hydrogenophaga sp. PAMC20947 TaxID=2565558 RepID=UPI00109DA213|nr:YqiA/YcfP family alpha/beta fold hydrolase [Hydrogenophaga sp. PAMC20947]QCB48198.1 esterase [Hydrogenophaga sp. PAMC20947]
MPTNTCPSTSHVLYLHGFRSSPQSVKARQVAERVRLDHPQVVWHCPQLPPSPAAAWRLIQAETAAWPSERMVVIGSSLGGFYARALSLQRGCRAALLNPAVLPSRDLAHHIGEQTSWHDPDERFFFEPGYVQELEALETLIRQKALQRPHRPDQLFALITQGDEVLSWEEMSAACEGGTVRLLPGGDHAISDFSRHMDDLFRYLALVF